MSRGDTKDLVESSFRQLVKARQEMLDYIKENGEVFGRFSALADSYNDARQRHVGALKTSRMDSPLYRMQVPRKFVCKDFEQARTMLGIRFPEFVETQFKPKTDAIRNAIAAGSVPGIESVFLEVEDTPRHFGPKEIDLSALRGE